MKILYVIKIFLALLFVCPSIYAETFKFEGDKLFYEGEINKESFEKIKKFIKQGGKELVINSEGGDAKYGQKIGLLLAEKNISLIVDKYCLSSCANYLFLGAKEKSLKQNAILGFHGGMGVKINSNLKLANPIAKQISDLIQAEKTFFEKIKVNYELIENSGKITHSKKNFYVVTVNGEKNFEKLFEMNQEQLAKKLVSDTLEVDPEAKWSIGIQNEIINKVYFPSSATLAKYKVRGIVSYPYPINQTELNKIVDTLVSKLDVNAVGDFNNN